MLNFYINQHLSIREISMKDADAIFQTINTQRMYLGKWLPFVEFTTEKSDTEDYIRSVKKLPENHPDKVFVIHEYGKFAGIAGYKDTDLQNQKTEIGYWLSEPYQGKGIMTAVVNKMLAYAFNEMKMNRVQIKCAVGNTRSSNIPKRLGFSFEGIERAGELLSGGVFADLEVYSLLKGEYNSGI
jgi:ribosomal-protein-serine acetyltransferase